ncbi:iron-containing alcohol dehydrogenase [Ammoniphilus sp. YIM 78166]|uniref:iron-containing alcohol dehydrogenase n=1 Tax=Ammoniphilus sp. YIM 78166 TaxID=1644106 RepID=UPI00106F8FCD|nr:iron-containing alcohol dehydrogenase [Ammoniphilus sp. YIM 78166]
MHSGFQFHLPTKIIFGFGKTQELGQLPFGMKRAFLVTDRGVMQAGILEQVTKVLSEHGISFTIYDEVEPDPSVETIDFAAKAYIDSDCDAIIAVGGGSPIDAAKGIRAVASNGGSIRDYAGVNLLKKPSSIPFVAIPTTSGTGSEVTIFAVFSDWQEKRKVTVTSPYLAPDISIVDPKLTLSAPAGITAASGMDAFAHAAETFVSRISQPASDALALSAMRTAVQYLRRAVYNGEDQEARIKMAEASLLAGMAFNQSYLGLTHAIGSALSGHAHVSHGVAIALLLPSVMDYNLVSAVEKYAEIAAVFRPADPTKSTMEIAKQGVQDLTQLRDDLGLPTTLREVGVKEEQIPLIAEDTLKSGMWKFNPRKASPEHVQALLKTIY